jgi:adenylate kinase family enzyme
MIVFLLGIPGCGKSEFYRRLTGRIEKEKLFDNFPRIDDFPKLWAIFQEDEKTSQWKRCRPTPDGGYKVTDDTVWDDILKKVNVDVLDMLKIQDSDTLLFIEFSRPNYVHSILNNFSKEILDKALAVYLDVPFDICWERNVRRHEKALAKGTDNHLVSREEMEKTYGSDDKNLLENELSMPVVFINNDARGENDFTKLDYGVSDVFSMIKGMKSENG